VHLGVLPICLAIWDWVKSSTTAEAEDQPLAFVELRQAPLERQFVVDQRVSLRPRRRPTRRRVIRRRRHRPGRSSESGRRLWLASSSPRALSARRSSSFVRDSETEGERCSSTSSAPLVAFFHLGHPVVEARGTRTVQTGRGSGASVRRGWWGRRRRRRGCRGPGRKRSRSALTSRGSPLAAGRRRTRWRPR